MTKATESPLEDLDAIEAEISAPAADAAPPPGEPAEIPAEGLAAPPPPEDLDDEAMGSLIQGLTGYIANRAGDKWRATDEEARQIAECANKVMLKYAPAVAKYQEETALGIVLVAYLLPRLQIALPATEEPEPAAAGAGDDPV